MLALICTFLTFYNMNVCKEEKSLKNIFTLYVLGLAGLYRTVYYSTAWNNCTGTRGRERGVA